MSYRLLSDEQARRVGRAVRAYESEQQGPPGDNRLLPVPQPHFPTRAKLLENLMNCGHAKAQPFEIDPDGNFIYYQYTIDVYDTMDVMAGSLLAIEMGSGSNDFYVEAGNVVFLKFFLDSMHHEILQFGDAVCEPAGSGGSEEGSSDEGSADHGSGGGSGEGSGGETTSIPAPPAGCTPQWVMDTVSGCYVLACCPSSGSGG